MVGTGRFELPTPRTPSECSTRLSHVPTRQKLLNQFTGQRVYQHAYPAQKPKLVAGWNIFLRQCGAFAEEILCHLLYKEFLCLRRPGLETVFIEQHLLV